MRHKKEFGPTEVASFFGVTRITVYRWCEEGKLRFTSTAGGHHRIPAADILSRLKALKRPIPRQLSSSVATIVLIVDDEEPTRRVLKRFLSKIHPKLDIHEASDGYEAGHITRALKPQLVILDLMLPGIDGITVCKLIKKDSALKGTKILAITGHAIDDLKRKVLKAGADVFMEKPFDFSHFQSAVERLLSLS